MECLRKQLARTFRIDDPAALREVDREEVQIDQHRGVSFRRRDADLGTGVEIHDVVGHAARLAADDVDEGEQPRALTLRLFHRGERVYGLAGLGHRDDQLPRRDDGLAVAVFARDLDIARDARQPLDQVLADEARVRRGPAGDKADPRDGANEGVVHLHVVIEDDSAGRSLHAPEERVRDRARLLVDLLQEKVLVSGFRRGDRIPRDLFDLLVDPLARELPEAHRVLGHDRDLAVVEEAHAACVLEKSRRIRRQEILAVAIPHDDAAGVGDPRGHDLPRVADGDERECRGALEPWQDGEGRILEALALFQLLLEQVDRDLGVRLARETVSPREERRFQ